MRHVEDQRRRQFVTALQQIYSSLPLDLLAKKLDVNTQEARQYVHELIEQGKMSGSFDQVGGKDVLRFDGASAGAVASRGEEAMREELKQQTKRIQLMSTHIEQADQRLSLSREHLEHVRRARKGADDRGVEEETMDMTYTAPESEEDESTMTDAR